MRAADILRFCTGDDKRNKTKEEAPPKPVLVISLVIDDGLRGKTKDGRKEISPDACGARFGD